VVERQAASVVMLRTADELDAAAELLWKVWGAQGGAERNEVISGVLLRTLKHSGNYVAGVFDGPRLIGCAVGMFGSHASDGSVDHLHSYIAGVDPERSDRGVGYAMKRHQRQWALDHDLKKIMWTFDPLVARNAYVNLCKLGATVVSYEPEFYGRLDDGLNTDQSTDRLMVKWDLLAPWVERAMNGDRTGMRRLAVVLPVAERIAIPEDISVLREKDPDQAERERDNVRRQFQSLIARGYRVAGLSRDGEYVLLPDGVDAVFEG
jgi:predicted GNAT superfamily acetyltransferase